MEYVEVQDEKIPALGIGTWQLKGRDCVKAVKSALNSGYKHVDTAQAYRNEEKVGKGIEQSEVDREDIWLTTKVWRDSLNKQDLRESVEESLEKLRTEYVDLLLIHWPFQEMNLEAVIEEMDKLVEEVKARKIGISNFNIRQTEKAQKLSEHDLLTNQVEYHPFLNQDAVFEQCRDMDMMLTAYSPLARGDVIGNNTLQKIGEKYRKSEVQVALRWFVQQENVAAIPKATSEEHIKSNLDIFDFELNGEEMKEISKLSRGDRKVDPGFAPEWD
ncbi:aldo/keto reductase [Nanohaloarchaea archaeon H01]|nr:aldo/keto reductase [Nanohaloarchaea archaeon H01]